jgi:hypothetical protein
MLLPVDDAKGGHIKSCIFNFLQRRDIALRQKLRLKYTDILDDDWFR